MHAISETFIMSFEDIILCSMRLRVRPYGHAGASGTIARVLQLAAPPGWSLLLERAPPTTLFSPSHHRRVDAAVGGPCFKYRGTRGGHERGQRAKQPTQPSTWYRDVLSPLTVCVCASLPPTASKGSGIIVPTLEKNLRHSTTILVMFHRAT
jgi:hypothetical protein